jgi:hypothetical protein
MRSSKQPAWDRVFGMTTAPRITWRGRRVVWQIHIGWDTLVDDIRTSGVFGDLRGLLQRKEIHHA